LAGTRNISVQVPWLDDPLLDYTKLAESGYAERREFGEFLKNFRFVQFL